MRLALDWFSFVLLLIRALTKSPGVFTSGLFLAAGFANTIHHHVDLFHGIAFGQLNFRNGYFIETNGFTTGIAFEVDMVIMMVSRYNAGFVAQGISGDIIR